MSRRRRVWVPPFQYAALHVSSLRRLPVTCDLSDVSLEADAPVSAIRSQR